MLDNSGISTENYDNILISWSQQDLQNDLNLGASGLFYCNAETERQSIIDNFNWIIIDEGIGAICDDIGCVEKTYIPDDEFEEHIISLGLDDTMDDYVCTANISDLTSLSFSPGENIIGIQDFISLGQLNLHTSETITSLDLSILIWLNDLVIHSNAQLESALITPT